ncbi:MAG: sialidase family protein [Planctomycetaceae bacterium]
MPHPRSLSLSMRFGLMATLLLFVTAHVTRGDDPPGPQLLEERTISPPEAGYAGWPTLTRLHSGELMVVWSGGRESHVCPFGQVLCMTSRDSGVTWTWPRVLLDSAIDDRDAGVLQTAQGTLLVTTFTSLAYVPTLHKARQQANWDANRLARWEAVHARLRDEQRTGDLGTWMIRSTDGGQTWSTRYDSLVNSPHGPINLSDGRILYAGKQLWSNEKQNGVAISNDDGATWQWLADIPTRPGDDPAQYHELHAVETAPGHLIVQIRNHNPTNHLETLQCESTDGGRTWTEPHSIGVWGFPSHLLKLRDGRLLMSYGHRRAPRLQYGPHQCQQRQVWFEPRQISSTAASTDLGYPSTVELDDGNLLTIWYEKLPDQPEPCAECPAGNSRRNGSNPSALALDAPTITH